VNEYVKLAIWAAIILAIFGVLWWQGHLVRLRTYVLETREELRKCTWPSWHELKGSTVVVMISIAILAAFTMGVDALLVLMVRWMTQI
jgi:preprotein translocase subunit SecE